MQADLFDIVFESSPNILMLVDKDVRVEKINRTGRQFAGAPHQELIGLLSGEVLQCVSSFNGRGCGCNPECADCPIRARITRSFQSGEAILNEEGRLTVRTEAQDVRIDFLISTVPVQIADETKVLVTIVDITERKRSEQALRKSEERYLQIVENSPNPIFSIDQNGRIQSWNRACEKTFQYDQNIIGQHYRALLRYTEDELAIEPMLDKARQGQSSSGIDMVYRSQDGKECFMVSRIYPLLTSQGEVHAFVVANTDVTARKKAEEELRKSKQSLEEAERLVHLGHYEIDITTGEACWSDEIFNIFGIDPRNGAPTSESYYDLVHPDDQPTVKQLYEESTQKGVPFDFAYRILRQDRSIRYVHSSAKVIRNEAARLVLFGTFQDITKLKQAELALQESESLYHDLVETAQDLIWQCDCEGRYIYLNPAWEEVFGYSLDEMLGKPFTDFLPPEYISRELKKFAQLMKGEAVTRYEMVHLAKNGSELQLVFNAKAIRDAQGKIVGARGTAYDNTERDHAERELREYAAQLESIREVSLELTSQLNLDVLLQFIANKAIELLDAVEGGMYLYRPERDVLEWVVGVHSPLPVGSTLKRGEGLAGKVWQNGTPMLVDDYQHWDGRAEVYDRYAFKAALGAPIFLRNMEGEDEFLGVLSVDRVDSFSKPDIKLLNLFTTQAAVAIHNAQLYKLAQHEIEERARVESAVRRHAEELAGLQKTILEITQPHSLDELLKFIVERAASLVGASGGGLYLNEPEHQRVRCVVSYNTLHDYTGTTLEYGVGAAGQIALTGEPLIIDDYRSWLGRAQTYEEEQPFQVVMSAPLLWQGNVTGVLHMLRNDSQKFTQADLDLLILFANHASVAVENARLYASIEQELAERKQTEIALQESAARYRAVVENQTEFITRWKPDGRRTFVNETYLRYFDLTMQEALSSGFIAHIAEEERNAKQEQITQLVSGELSSSTAIHKVIKPDGTYGWQEWTDNPIYNDQGELIEFQSVGRDVTERILADEALRTKTEELEALFSISSHLRSAQSADEMLPLILAEMRRVLYSDANGVILLDSGKEQFTYSLSDGPLEVNNSKQFGVEKSISGLVLQSRQPYITEDLSSDSNKTSALQGDDQLGPAMFVPVISESEFIGVLLCARNKGADSRLFSASEARLLTAIGEMVGNALRRTRLYDQALTRLQQVQTLHAIDMAISANLELSVILDMLLNQGIIQLEVDAATILLLNPHTHMLEYAAGHGFRNKEIRSTRLRLGEGLPGKAAVDRAVLQMFNFYESDSLVRKYLVEEGFVSYQVAPLIAKGQLHGVMEAFKRKPTPAGEEQLGFLETLATQAAIAIDNTQLFNELQRSNFELEMAYDATIEGWSRALELRDQETEGHTLRVTEMTLQLAQAMGIRSTELIHVRRGALLHDIGKMGVPDRILLKPGKLDDEEWEIMKQHTVYAFEMLWPIDFLRPALDIPHFHHERWDGTGYPNQLKAEQIPLSARTFAVADAWDALTSDRPYRKAWSEHDALEYITTQAGVHFDPRVVEAFLILQSKNSK